MNFSRITDNIFVGTTPRLRDYNRLHEMGVRLVINMRILRGRPPGTALQSVQYLRLRTFDSPLVPIPAEALVRGARAALQVIDNGGSVYTHCARGRHRSAAMGAAILIAQGLTPEAAMQLIKERRPEADPEASHIRPRIIEFAHIWRSGAGSVAPEAA
jgi:protein tyrosine phosphatase (PTP) superfamily phosphohydrolase (DUF442 family)